MFGYRHGKGALVVNGEHVADTLQCVHCGMHWVPAPGSGTKRGWCSQCKGHLCGKEACFTCLPLEAFIEVQEGSIKPGNKYFDAFIKQYGNRV